METGQCLCLDRWVLSKEVTVHQETKIPWTASWTGTLATTLLVLLVACSSAGAGPQTGGVPAGSPQTATPPAPEREAAAAGLVLTCEVYCSETKLRTANARLRWRLVPGGTLDAARAGALSTAEQRLQTTVFKNGFEKDLYVSLPVSQRDAAGYENAVPSGALARQGRGVQRAYQIRVIEVARPRSADQFAAGAEETAAVIENLEPGMNYTWRLVIEADSDNLVSPAVRCRAPICPADMVREEEP